MAFSVTTTLSLGTRLIDERCSLGANPTVTWHASDNAGNIINNRVINNLLIIQHSTDVLNQCQECVNKVIQTMV